MLWTIATNPSSSIKIQCDDTDVFALMVHYVHRYQLKNTVLMEATKSGRQVIDIHLSIEKMVSAGYDPALILPLHAISGCDTVAAWQPTLGLPRRRHSLTQRSILRRPRSCQLLEI